MQNRLFLLSTTFIVVLALAACRNNPKGVQEQNGNITNADMVHNPVSADTPRDTVNVPKLVFTEDKFDFGKIKAGDKVTHAFAFKNIGKAPLLITNARSTCGCTIPEFPKDPIPVGASGEISVTFNSTGKEGAQDKPIIITANTVPTEKTYVHIKGDVIPAPK